MNSPTGRVILAPDKFRGSLGAAAVARHLEFGLRAAGVKSPVETLPVADGGEGTISAAVSAGFEARSTSVTDPLGRPHTATWAQRATAAVIELAQASGRSLVEGDQLDPLGASTSGTGELIRAALDAGCTNIVLAVGGSATIDGGAGLLRALGARLTDADGQELPPGGGALLRLAHLDLTGLDRRLARVHFVLAADVDNPLTGPNGAAAVFGPQKGATPADVRQLDAGLHVWARALAQVTGQDQSRAAGAGAAGGVGVAALSVLRAERRQGVDVVLDLVDFDRRAAGARLVITGEGSLDAQSLAGKAPIGVARRARALAVRTVAVVGRNQLDPAQWGRAGFSAVYPLTDLEPDLDRCRVEAGALLEGTARVVAAAELP